MAIDEARSWLGEPDEQIKIGATQIDRYWLAREQHATPRGGGVYGQLELRYAGDRVAQGDIRYFRWEMSPEQQASFEMTADELRARGLTAHVLGP